MHTHHCKYSATCQPGEQKAESKPAKTNATVQCWCVKILLVPLSECVSMFCMYAYMCVRMYCTVLMHGLPTCVRTHFSVIRHRPKPPGSRSCGGNGHSRSPNISQSTFFRLCTFQMFNIEHTHTHTHTHTHIYDYKTTQFSFSTLTT